jgi:hypothetical protein
MARACHGLPKVLLGSAMRHASTPWGRATPKVALQLFQGWPACRAGNLRPSSTTLDTPRRMSMGTKQLRAENQDHQSSFTPFFSSRFCRARISWGIQRGTKGWNTSLWTAKAVHLRLTEFVCRLSLSVFFLLPLPSYKFADGHPF